MTRTDLLALDTMTVQEQAEFWALEQAAAGDWAARWWPRRQPLRSRRPLRPRQQPSRFYLSLNWSSP